MIPMVEDEVMPRLRVAAGEPAVLRSRLIHCWGLGESAVADILDDMFAAANPSVAFLIRDMEVRVRVTAKGGDEASALEMIAPVESEIRRRLGDVVFAVGEETVEEIVLDRLHRHGWTVATVEDATLGQIGARLAAADSRSVLVGAVIRGNGAVARPEADVVLEVGPIGPDATDGPRTTRDVTMTVETPEARVTRRFDFGGDDERLRAFATAAGLHALRTALESPAE